MCQMNLFNNKPKGQMITEEIFFLNSQWSSVHLHGEMFSSVAESEESYLTEHRCVQDQHGSGLIKELLNPGVKHVKRATPNSTLPAFIVIFACLLMRNKTKQNTTIRELGCSE